MAPVLTSGARGPTSPRDPSLRSGGRSRSAPQESVCCLEQETLEGQNGDEVDRSLKTTAAPGSLHLKTSRTALARPASGGTGMSRRAADPEGPSEFSGCHCQTSFSFPSTLACLSETSASQQRGLAVKLSQDTDAGQPLLELLFSLFDSVVC